MAGFVVSEEGPCDGMTYAPESSALAPVVTRVVMESGGERGVNGAINAGGEEAVLHPMNVAAGAHSPFHRIPADVRNEGGGKDSDDEFRAEKIFVQVAGPALVKRHG